MKISKKIAEQLQSASNDNKLFLVRSIGPFSGGTRVNLVSTDPLEVEGVTTEVVKDGYKFRRYTKRATVKVNTEDLVLRR